MKKLMLVLLATVLVVPGLRAADVTAPIHQFIDGFNKGDTKSVYAAYATGDIMIVDEFAPHRWSGPNAPQAWASDYEKHAQATGVSDGQVKYGSATRTEIEGDTAYVIVPTTYLYKEHGKSMAEKGEMTFVLQNQVGAWKINAWIWSGEKPHPAK
jgi:ketosteroid isomerase-like protein